MTTAKAVRTLKASHLRPVVRFTQHVRGQPGGIVVGAPSGWIPFNVGGGQKAEVAHEGGVVGLVVSR
jgi:hypothetical protein